MTTADILRLVSLAAIWGGSFMLVRYSAPYVDAAWLSELRVGVAAIAMLAYARAIRLELNVAARWRAYVVMGVLNTAMPWSMYAWAGHHISASYMAILNATTPWFSAACGAIWLGEAFTARKAAGLALGVLGVVLLVGLGPIALSNDVILAIAAAIIASLCYSLAGTYAKKRVFDVPPIALAAGNLTVATLVIMPFALAAGPPPHALVESWRLAGAVLTLALVCSALAFVSYYRLLVNVGPTRALTVTFLIPVFGVLFGAVFLGETLTLSTLAGGLLIIAATTLVAGGGRAAA
jgi:drug/metabolite transporter (DMT)-like permease